MDHIVSCDGKLFSASIESSANSPSQIKVEVFSLCSKDKRFSNIRTVLYKFCQRSEHVKILKVQEVLELSTCLKVVLVFTEKLDKLSQNYSYELFMLNSAGQSVLVTHFSVSHKLGSSDFKLIDGPCIMWQTDSILSVASTSCNCRISDVGIALDDILYTGYCTALDNVLLLAYGRTTGKNACTNKITLSAFTFDLSADNTVLKENNDILQLFPRDFSNIKTLLVENHSTYNEDSLPDSIEKCKFISYAVTQQGHIIKFNCDKVEGAMNSELNGSRDSKLYKWKSYGLDKEFLAHLNNQDMCLIDLETMQIVLRVKDVQAVLLDDFLLRGCNQLLIMEKKLNVQTQWTLTEYGTLREDGSVVTENDQHGKDVKQNVKSAIEALNTRLQSDLILLNEEKTEVMEERQHFITDTWQRLTCNSEGIKLQPFLAPVTSVPLLEEESSWSHCVPAESGEEINKPSVCGELWQRIVGNEWVVGAEIRNTTPRSVFSPILCPVDTSSGRLTSDQHTFSSKSMYKLQSVETDSKSQDIKGEYSTTESSFKKRKLQENYSDSKLLELPPSSQFSLVSVTEIPKFSSARSISFDVILKWRNNNADNGRTWHSLYCGNVTLSVRDVISGKYLVDLGRNSNEENSDVRSQKDVDIDLEALSSVQKSTSLILKSAWTDLGMVPHWLRTRAGFDLHPLYKAYVSRGLNPLSGARLADFQYDKADKAGMTVHTHDQNQLYLLIQHLYQSFPDDIVILPTGSSNMTEYHREALFSITSELRYHTDSSDQSSKVKGYDDDIDMFPEKDESGKINVQNVRANFAKRKRSLSPRTSVTESDRIFLEKEEKSRLESITDRSLVMLQSRADFM